MLSSLLDLCYEHCAFFNGAAMADAEYLLMLGYIYEGYVKLNYYSADAVLHSSTLTDMLARTMRIFACLCAFVEYLLCSVGRLAV